MFTAPVVVGLLFLACIVCFIFELRCEQRRAQDANDALRELLAMAKQKGRRGHAARQALRCWASVPPVF
jgi:hypothetical protein